MNAAYRLAVMAVVLWSSFLHAEHGLLPPLLPQLPSVLGGEKSKVKQVIAIVGVGYCSATVVGEREIVTAAHCVHGARDVQPLLVAKPIPDGEDELSTSFECVSHPKYSRPSDGDGKNRAEAEKNLATACEDLKKKKITQKEADAALEKILAGRSITVDEMETDIAVCRLKKGKLDIPPATIAKHDPLKNSLAHVGFGCNDVREGKRVGTGEQRMGNAKLRSGDEDKGVMSTQFKLGDADRAGLCPGDSGGFLGSVSGDKVLISGVHSASNALQQTYDWETCRHVSSVREEGTGYSVNLLSKSSLRFLRGLKKEGWQFNGI